MANFCSSSARFLVARSPTRSMLFLVRIIGRLDNQVDQFRAPSEGLIKRSNK